MFVDKVQVTIRAGKGGDGMVSFRREKYISRGGPDGGDGGSGGNVIARASRSQNTLANFRFKKILAAKQGDNGRKKKQHGKNGQDLVLDVPLGTVIANAKGKVLADLTDDGQTALIARGGKGGFGNAHFVSSTRQAPRLREKGEPGEEIEVTLELKMIADVGLIGLPNAGKSTLLAYLSNAKPEIANYPFTTTSPNLGMVDVDDSTSLLFADIPGLIEGASQGKGLGDEFLRHVERTKLLVHLVDVYQEDVASAYHTIQKELADYSSDLSKLPQIVALNKIDGLDQEILDDQTNKLKKAVKNAEILPLSAHSGQGVKELLFAVKKAAGRTKKEPVDKPSEGLPVIGLKTTKDSKWSVETSGKKFVVSGRKIENFAKRTDFGNPEGVERLKDIMGKMGIMRELERKGARAESEIQLGKEKIGTIQL